MAKSHGKNARILFAEFDLSNYFRELEVQRTVTNADATAFQDGWDKSVSGPQGGGLRLDGFFDGATDAVDEELDAAFGTDATQVVTVGVADMAVGAPVKMLLSRVHDYAIKSPFRDINQVSGEITADDKIVGGVSLRALASGGGGETGTAVDHGAATSGGALAHLHVTANARTQATTVKVQHSADNSVWADLITFTDVPATTKTSQRSTAAGTVNRYTRQIHTVPGGTGTLTYAVAVARL